MRGRRRPDSGDILQAVPGAEASWPATVALVVFVFLILIANGRPIGSGDSRSVEHVAVSLVTEGNLDLDEFPAVTEPFARTVGSHRISVYPVLTAIVASPVFAAVRPFYALDETGSQLAGKWAAALLSAWAAGFLFRAVTLRHTAGAGATTAILFALGTSVFSTSQALWQHPAVLFFLCLALWFIARGEGGSPWISRAALPLALAAAARHAVAPLVAVVFLGLALKHPWRIPGLIVWGALPIAGVALYQSFYFGSPLTHAFSDSASRFSEPWGMGQLAVLFSPAKGLLVFTPLVLVAAAGLVRAFRSGEAWFAGTLGAAVLAHLAVVGRWSEWHGGECFGPRLMTDALPLLFLFLPEGREAVRGFLFTLAAAASIAVQVLGVLTYDYRWERLFQRRTPKDSSWVWNVRDSPIAFHAREHVLIAALPAVTDGRARVREHRFVPGAPKGSLVVFADARLVVSGSEPAFSAAHLQRGARVEGGHASLAGRWDGIVLRMLPAMADRRLELQVAGRGRGTLYVGTSTFWGAPPRYTAYPMAGDFEIRHPYAYADGNDVVITIGRADGFAEITRVTARITP